METEVDDELNLLRLNNCADEIVPLENAEVGSYMTPDTGVQDCVPSDRRKSAVSRKLWGTNPSDFLISRKFCVSERMLANFRELPSRHDRNS